MLFMISLQFILVHHFGFKYSRKT